LNSNNAWLEITTRSGAGPYQRHTPGTWLYKPQPFYFGKLFYRPRYPVGGGDKGAGLSDLRSTIHWASDIITDSTGHATISFFAADRPGSYRIVVEGSDMNGQMGTGEGKVEVGKR
jgi:hypothetical protein